MLETAKDVAIIGAGYVGLVTGAALAHLGHRVTGVDHDAAKIAALNNGVIPIYEPGLGELAAPLLASGALRFTTDLKEAVRGAGIVFICVGTPPDATGAADMSAVETVARAIGAAMDGAYRVVVNKSTVPVGSAALVTRMVQNGFAQTHGAGGFAPDFDVVSNPEFLREGSAIADTFYPDRIVIGTHAERAMQEMEELYAPLIEGRFSVPGLHAPETHRAVPLVSTEPASAEMIKYAANAFLALKISFINEIAAVCESVGADVTHVSKGIGYDARIGRRFLEAGLGWGGSCFDKDINALRHAAARNDVDTPILGAAVVVNEGLREACFRKVQAALGTLEDKTVGLLGLAFKPNTDDLRDAPALTLAARFLGAGAVVKAYDPVAMPGAAAARLKIQMAEDPYALAEGCDAIVLATDWPQFRALDMARIKSAMRAPVFVDGRNLYDPHAMTAAGFRYLSFGR